MSSMNLVVLLDYASCRCTSENIWANSPIRFANNLLYETIRNLRKHTLQHIFGDFYELPPAPTSASLLALTISQSYDHPQGWKLLSDIGFVFDFMHVRRFVDPLQIQVLETMRTRGGKNITEKIWQAIFKTRLQEPDCGNNNIKINQPGVTASNNCSHNIITQPTVWYTRLRKLAVGTNPRRIVSYGINTTTRPRLVGNIVLLGNRGQTSCEIKPIFF